MKKIILEQKKYTLEDIYEISSEKNRISLSSELKKNIRDSREFINKKINASNSIYGINTGFGKLSSVKINQRDINKLQKNLILSHAIGVGENISNRIVRIIILLPKPKSELEKVFPFTGKQFYICFRVKILTNHTRSWAFGL
mgnify:CR=1 FL=1